MISLFITGNLIGVFSVTVVLILFCHSGSIYHHVFIVTDHPL